MTQSYAQRTLADLESLYGPRYGSLLTTRANATLGSLLPSRRKARYDAETLRLTIGELLTIATSALAPRPARRD